MKKLIIILEGGRIQYLFSDQRVDVEIIDNDTIYKSTQQKEEEFQQLINDPDLVLSYTNN